MKPHLLNIFCLFVFITSWSQETGYLIRNYSPKEYDGYNQVWCAAQDSAGNMYFGTSTHIIKYDGSEWKKIFVKNGLPIRSLQNINNRIYVGLPGDFGYIDFDGKQKPFFHSLSSLLGEKEKHFTDIWKVHHWNNLIIFQSSERIYFFDGKSFRYIEPHGSNSFALSFLCGGKLYVRERDAGMMEVTPGLELKLIKGGDYFKDLPVISFCDDEKNGRIIAGGSRDGIMFYNKSTGITVPLSENLNRQFRELFPLTLSREDEKTWFLSGRGGFYILNEDFSVRTFFNKENGLYDEVVTGTYFSSDDNLWLTLNNGISMIELNSDGYYLTEKSGFKGTPEDIVIFNEHYFLATTNSVYTTSNASVRDYKIAFSPLPLEISEYWDLEQLGEKLFAASSSGLFEIQNKVPFQVHKRWTRFLAKAGAQTPFLAAFEKNFISIIDVSREKSAVVKEFEFPGEEFMHGLFEKKGNEYLVWAASPGGVVRLTLDEDFNLVRQEKYGAGDGLPEGQKNLYAVNGQVILVAGDKIFSWEGNPGREKEGKKFIRMDKQLFENDLEFSISSNFNGKPYSGTIFRHYFLQKASNGNFRKMAYTLKPHPIKDLQSYITDDSLRTWFLGPEFLILLKKPRKEFAPGNFGINFTLVQAGRDSSSVCFGKPENVQFPYKNNFFAFQYSAPFFVQPEQTVYRCRLIGSSDTEWTQWGLTHHKEFTNLHEGEYSFCIQAKNIFGDESAINCFSFTVLPPWYRMGWAYLLYGILFIVLVYALVRLSNYRLTQSKIKLEKTVTERTRELQEKKKEITDSIKYALRIQTAILPPENYFRRLLPDSFIFYRPKDIVSGDFYWVETIRGKVLFAVVDCTGHGVPGAMMSVIGLKLLNTAVLDRRLDVPADILNFLDKGVHETLRQGEAGSGVKDGMDLAICSWEKSSNILEYAGVFNSLWLVRKNIAKTWKIKNNKEVLFGDHLLELKPDKMAIGNNVHGNGDNYFNHFLRLEKGDCVYIYSDGYADQFGGPAGKKFKYNQLKELLVRIADLPVKEQENILADTFDKWKRENEQIDDVLVMGIKIS